MSHDIYMFFNKQSSLHLGNLYISTSMYVYLFPFFFLFFFKFIYFSLIRAFSNTILNCCFKMHFFGQNRKYYSLNVVKLHYHPVLYYSYKIYTMLQYSVFLQSTITHVKLLNSFFIHSSLLHNRNDIEF
jgi:hypothetical protein